MPYMKKNFMKWDLAPGMVVETRHAERFLVVPCDGGLAICNENGGYYLDIFKSDLSGIDNYTEDLDIVRVWGTSSPCLCFNIGLIEASDRELIWEREGAPNSEQELEKEPEDKDDLEIIMHGFGFHGPIKCGWKDLEAFFDYVKDDEEDEIEDDEDDEDDEEMDLEDIIHELEVYLTLARLTADFKKLYE